MKKSYTTSQKLKALEMALQSWNINGEECSDKTRALVYRASYFLQFLYESDYIEEECEPCT